ncbi:MAG: sugar transferase [Candidatus Neomarinimicrobiota bacterium]
MKFLPKIVAVILFILLIPFFLVISLISLLSQGRPIIFKQTRMGLNFKKFTIYKFRSMHKSSEGINSFSNGKVFSATKWGHFIRKMKIDELPQLYNIIKGDMAFIGPRPEIPEFVDFKSFRYLSYIKPGLSCYSTILFRDESQKFTFLDKENSYKNTMIIKTFLDNYYLDKKNVIEDAKLVILTILSIFFSKTMTKYSSENFLKLYYERYKNLKNVPPEIIIDNSIESEKHILGSN